MLVKWFIFFWLLLLLLSFGGLAVLPIVLVAAIFLTWLCGPYPSRHRLKGGRKYTDGKYNGHSIHSFAWHLVDTNISGVEARRQDMVRRAGWQSKVRAEGLAGRLR